RLVDLFRYYKPEAMVAAAGAEPTADADVALIDVDAGLAADALTERVQRALRSEPNTLVLLHRKPAMSDERLRDALEAVRAAGARHYGYGFDDYVRGAPDVRRIVRALEDHTIVPAVR